MLQKIVLAIILIAAVSCKTVQLPDREDTVVTYVERVKDTTIYVSDTASINALLECDSLGQVRLKEIQSLQSGQYVKPPTIVIQQAKPGQSVLTASCVIDSAAIYLTWKERDTTTNTVVTQYEYLKKPPNAWQKLQMWFGRISFLALLIYLGVATGFFKMILKTLKPV